MKYVENPKYEHHEQKESETMNRKTDRQNRQGKKLLRAVAAVMTMLIMVVSCFSGIAESIATPSDITPSQPNPPAGCQHNWVTKFDDNNHWQECTLCGEKGAAEGHNKVWTEGFGTIYGIKNSFGHQKKCTKCDWKGELSFHNGHVRTYDPPKGTACAGERTVTDICDTCGKVETYTEIYSDEHEYDWNDVVTYPATCTSGEWSGWICKRCGYKLKGVETSLKKGHEGELIERKPLGHDWKETVTVSATCTSEGKKERVCARCGAKETDTVIPKTDHKWKTTVTKQATCQEAGEQTKTCSVCGTTQTEVIPVAPHNFKENILKSPTCTELGSVERVCTVCGEYELNSLPMKPHSFTDVVTKQATCTVEGEKELTCSVCVKKETQTIPKKAHDWETKVTAEATCTKEGSKTLTCKVCGTSKTETIPVIAHKWKTTVTKEPTETENGTRQKVCAVCGTKKTEKIPATGSSDDVSIAVPDGTATEGTVSADNELSFILTADIEGNVAQPYVPGITAEQKDCKHQEGYYYVNTGKAAHTKICRTCGKEVSEKCTKSCKVYGSNATFNCCPLCGYATGLDAAKDSTFATYTYLVKNTVDGTTLCDDLIAVTYVKCNFRYNKKVAEGFILVSRMSKSAKESMKDIEDVTFSLPLEDANTNLEGKTLKYIQQKKGKTSLKDVELDFSYGIPVLNVEHTGVYLIMSSGN